MKKMKPHGTFPTPYGVSVPVYRPPELKFTDPDAFVFSMDATAFCAGIHDPAERARFVADAGALGRVPEFKAYGGHKVPRLPLLRPSSPVYPRLPTMDGLPVEAWITGTMDRLRWCDRAEFLIRIIGENMETVDSRTTESFEPIYCIGLSMMLTASLEHLGETELDCVEAAALYALTEHNSWRTAGLTWLRPFRETWFKDWALARPRYTRFAAALNRVWGSANWPLGAEDRP